MSGKWFKGIGILDVIKQSLNDPTFCNEDSFIDECPFDIISQMIEKARYVVENAEEIAKDIAENN